MPDRKTICATAVPCRRVWMPVMVNGNSRRFCRSRRARARPTLPYPMIASFTVAYATVLKREGFNQLVERALQRGLLLLQLRLAVAQLRELLLVGIQLLGVILHELLLAADVVQAVDVLPDAVFITGQVAKLTL